MRHAPTESNVRSFYMGNLDIPATERGLAEAARLRPVLEGKFSRVFTSPLRRSADTASAIFPARMIVVDKRLRERGLGLWEGLAVDDVRKRYPEAFLPNLTMDASYTPPDGEMLEDLISRIKSFFSLLVELQESGPVLIVTHNGWIRTAQYVCGEISLSSIYSESVPLLEPITFCKNYYSSLTRCLMTCDA